MNHSIARMIAPIVLMAGMSGTAWSQDGHPDGAAVSDAELAESLGADDYGMRRYVLVLLRTGPEREHGADEAAELQRGHMANIRRLAEQGHLVLAGPFFDSGDLRGLFLFAVDSVDEARELTATDPALAAGRFKAEYYPWYGSAALMKVSEIHARIAREDP